MKERIESLDWLRGLMAISIMVYHLMGWLFRDPDASGLLGRLGVYGVSIFFILSGLSMAIVYSKYISGTRSTIFFYIRRVFRIWPLLWICIALAVVLLAVGGKPVGGKFVLVILANLTTAFGFVKPGAYINTGAWSIGNEVVYYAMTPFILAAFKRSVSLGNVIAFSAFAVSMVFAFLLLRSSASLADQWATYINPFNNLFLYVAGIAIYFNLKQVESKPVVNGLMFLASVLFFVFYPTGTDGISIVTGMNRILFVAFSILLVTSFYQFRAYDLVPRIVGVSLEQFGIATYGVYLLHPLVKQYFELAVGKPDVIPASVEFVCVVAITVFLSLLSFHLIEKPLMRLGKRMTSSDGNRLGGFKSAN